MDTGTSMIIVPYKDYMTLVSTLCDSIKDGGMECIAQSSYSQVYITNCKDPQTGVTHLPPISIQLDQHIYTINPSIYTQEMQASSSCILNIMNLGTDRWILGSPFLNQYYQVYDMARNQMGMVPNIHVNNLQATEVTVPYSIDIIESKLIIICLSFLFLLSTSIGRKFIQGKSNINGYLREDLIQLPQDEN